MTYFFVLLCEVSFPVQFYGVLLPLWVDMAPVSSDILPNPFIVDVITMSCGTLRILTRLSDL